MQNLKLIHHYKTNKVLECFFSNKVTREKTKFANHCGRKVLKWHKKWRETPVTIVNEREMKLLLKWHWFTDQVHLVNFEHSTRAISLLTCTLNKTPASSKDKSNPAKSANEERTYALTHTMWRVDERKKGETNGMKIDSMSELSSLDKAHFASWMDAFPVDTLHATFPIFRNSYQNLEWHGCQYQLAFDRKCSMET